MIRKYAGLLMIVMSSGCTTWTPEQHAAREQKLSSQLQYAPIFRVVGTETNPASVMISASNFVEFAFYQRVPQIGPIDTTAQTAIKEAAGVGKALIAQTPVVAAAVIANAAFKNPKTTDTRIENTTTTTTTMGAE